MKPDIFKMKTILITGANGFIGKQICDRISSVHKTIAITTNSIPASKSSSSVIIKGDITDEAFVKRFFQEYTPDIIVHCAALAFESLLNPFDSSDYENINAIATENLCRYAAKKNPEVFFIFLSSIAVYGEKHKKKIIEEDDQLSPTSDYAKSKRNAEVRLKKLFNEKIIKKLDVLRLTPVYDENNLSTIEKRILAPKFRIFLKYGAGKQRMSILSLNNLVDFIEFRVKTQRKENEFSILNLADTKNYSFQQLIKLLKGTSKYSKTISIRVPLSLIWILIKLLELLFKKKSRWIHSWYDKLTKDFVFDNQRMRSTGFLPKHDLESFLQNFRK